MRHYARWSALLAVPLLLVSATTAQAQRHPFPTMGLRSAQPPRTPFVSTIMRNNNMMMRRNVVTRGTVVNINPFSTRINGFDRFNRGIFGGSPFLLNQALLSRFGPFTSFSYNRLGYGAAGYTPFGAC